MLERIPVLVNLAKRGLRVDSVMCKFCLLESEEVEHSFFTCVLAKQVWMWFWKWFGIAAGFPYKFESLVQTANLLKYDRKRWKLFWALAYGVLWEIWKARNELIFRHKKAIPMKVAEEIQINTYNWVKNRAHLGDLNWHSWCNCPNS